MRMKGKIAELEKIVVGAESRSQKSLSQTASVTRLSNVELTNIPGTADDVNRALSLSPSAVMGVSPGFTNELLVRGGSTGENVYLVEGIPFRDANHFSGVDLNGGALGFVNSALISEVNFYSGGFPARFEPKLSSIIDIRLRDGGMERAKKHVTLDLSGVGLTTEGPLAGSKGSYLAGIRIADISLLEPFLNTGGRTRYGDLLLRMNYEVSQKGLLDAVGVLAHDRYVDDTQKYFGIGVKQNRILTNAGCKVSWVHRFGKFRNAISGILVLRDELNDRIVSGYTDTIALPTNEHNISHYRRTGESIDTIEFSGDTLRVSESEIVRGRLSELRDRRTMISLKDDLIAFQHDAVTVSLGAGADHEMFFVQKGSSLNSRNYSIRKSDEGLTDTLTNYNTFFRPYLVDSALGLTHLGGFMECVVEHGRLKAVGGLRADYYSVLTSYALSPRFGMSLKIGRLGVFSLAGGLLHQFPAEFSEMLQVLLASDPNQSIKAPLNDVDLQRNWQIVFEHDLAIGELHSLKAALYYKYYDREYAYVIPNVRRYNYYENGELVWDLGKPRGEKTSAGFELSVSKKKFDAMYYALHFASMRIRNKYHDQSWNRDKYDMGSKLGVLLGSRFAKNHQIAFRFQVSEGRPYSDIRFDEVHNMWAYDSTSGFYTKRLKPFHTSHLRYTFHLFRSWGNFSTYIELWNIFNYRPVIERHYSPILGYIDRQANGIMPVLGIELDF